MEANDVGQEKEGGSLNKPGIHLLHHLLPFLPFSVLQQLLESSGRREGWKKRDGRRMEGRTVKWSATLLSPTVSQQSTSFTLNVSNVSWPQLPSWWKFSKQYFQFKVLLAANLLQIMTLPPQFLTITGTPCSVTSWSTEFYGDCGKNNNRCEFCP